MTTRRLLTVAQVGDVLQFSRRKVMELIDIGDLPAINVGSDRLHGARWRVEQRDLDRYLDARRKPPPGTKRR